VKLKQQELAHAPSPVELAGQPLVLHVWSQTAVIGSMKMAKEACYD
jgi:hypothetical protein